MTPGVDPKLLAAIRVLRAESNWAHVATVTPEGEPHVTPMLLGVDEEHLYLSLTGQRKRRNLARRPLVAISLARQADTAHVVVWGRVTERSDDWAQQRWERMIEDAGGTELLEQLRRPLSDQGTVLGVVDVERYRVYGVDDSTPTDRDATEPRSDRR